MDLVVDANILFSALIKDGGTAKVIFRDELHLYAPEFLLEEFSKHKKTILEKTHREEDEFQRLINVLSRRIIFIPKDEFEKFMPDAREISPDPDDAPYFGLAILVGADIWSNEKRLKDQDEIKVWSTGDLIEKFSL